MLTIPNTVSRVLEESVNEKRIYASVPCIKGTSERLQRAFKSHEVTLVNKPFNSLRSQLVRVKDKTENLKKFGTVYHIHCEQCDKDYVGETSRLLETRVKEHLSRDSSAVHEHFKLTGHSVDSSKTKVLATENNTFKRRIRKAIMIRSRKPSLNRDNRELKHETFLSTRTAFEKKIMPKKRTGEKKYFPYKQENPFKKRNKTHFYKVM